MPIRDTDDGRTVAPSARKRNAESVDELLARRLDPVQIAADLVATVSQLYTVERPSETTFAVVGVAAGSWPNAIAILDGADRTRAFVERFNRDGVPSVWPARTIVGLRLFAVCPEDVGGLADVDRGRWYLPAADGSDRVVDPATHPSTVAGGRRAERRRRETP
jgi:hypothetical protein